MDPLKYLCKRTDTNPDDWDSINGIPHSGVGTEYWYRNDKTGQEAYICVDQGEVISFSVQETE